MKIIHRALNADHRADDEVGSAGGHQYGHEHHHTHSLEKSDPPATAIAVRADRRTLAKTRWRAQADDGREFGFELAHPLRHGATVFADGPTRYVIEQLPETLLRVAVTNPAEAARVGWMIGNLHFPAQVRDGWIYVEADPAMRQMLSREGIACDEVEDVFQPLHASGGHHHH